MSSERMAILNMLEQGKITADNAAKLLAALDGPEIVKKNPEAKEERSYGSQEKEAPPADAKKWAADLGKKIEVIAKDLEPKVQKIAGAVAQKSVEIADMASKSIQNQMAAREKSKAAKPSPKTSAPGPAFGTGDSGKGTFELAVAPGYPNEIILRAPKGDISVKGYNGDKATINVSYKSDSGKKPVEFLQLGCVYQLNYNLDDYDKLKIDAYIPYNLFKHMLIETTEGNVSIDNINAEKITVNTSKCHVSVKEAVSDNMKIDNLDGPVLLSNSKGEKLVAENANAVIDATNTDFKELKLETTGDAISIVSQGFYKYNDYNWVIRTSNARIKASLPVSADTAYDLKAYTVLSDVSNGLPDICYSRNDRNYLEGKSANFASAAKKVRIELDTSNAPLTIN